MSEKFSTKKRIAVTAQGFNTFITEIFLLTRISNHFFDLLLLFYKLKRHLLKYE